MIMKRTFPVVFALMLVCFFALSQCTTRQSAALPSRILVFTKTAGFVHNSIPDGVAAIRKMGGENNWVVDTTSDSTMFTENHLKQYKAIIFLSTTGNVLNNAQQTAFEKYMQSGGGYVGVHAAADTEYDWPFYNQVVGAYFLSHPQQQKAVIQVRDKSHPSTSMLPDRWERFDEWYNYKSIMPGIKVLATLDESTYQGGKNGDNHPIIWHHEVGGGRAFYTGLGHTKETFTEPLFLRHLHGGIRYAMGEGK